MPLRSEGALPKLSALVLMIAALGLPINNLYAYGLLAVGTLLLFTGAVSTERRRWIAATALALAVLAQHVLLPSPRIEEGHNVFLIDGPGSALEKGLPPAAYRIMAERFQAAYPPAQRCTANQYLCWRPGGVPQQTFAFAADGIFDGHLHSRRVAGIDFRSPVWLRLGVINDLSLNFAGREGDVERLKRDRRSLAIFGRWQLKLPYFVMLRFPADFAGSRLCWRGELLWEGTDESFERLENRDWNCRTLQTEDVGRRIFGLAIGPGDDLAMSLDANGSVKARRALDAVTGAIGVVGILLLLLRWQPRRAVRPAVLIGCALAVIVVVDATFIGGFRPFDGGDDGLIFSGFARESLQRLVAGDILGALRGAEDVYKFTAGMRYFRMLEYLLFGDSYLGYLSVMLVAPLVVHALATRFLGRAWGLVFTLGFVATPIGVLFGTSYLHHIVWAARGFGDPLGATAFLAALGLLAGPPGRPFDDRVAPAFWGSLLMALAVFVRPNLVPGAAVLLGSVGLAALWQSQINRAMALGAGFLPMLFPAWHNWYFGGVFIPISDNVAAWNVYVMPPAAYVSALGELARLDFSGEHLVRAARQVMDLLSGPPNSWWLAPIHAVATAIVIRVVSSSRFDPMLRLTALAALALMPIALIYYVAVRYHLVMWFLMVLVVTAWIEVEGLALLDRRRPQWRERWRRSPAVARTARAVAWLST